MAERILFEDRHLVVCVKPAGVLSEDGGMPNLLSEQLHVSRIYCVHRLDRAVGGVMVYAKEGKTAARLSEMIAGREVKKEYLAVVQGTIAEERGEMRDLLFHDSAKNKSFVVSRPRRGVKEASLCYCRLETADDLSLVRIALETGRSHQIRVQFSSRRMPLVGDGKYGSTIKDTDIALWSFRLAFPHPVTGKALDFSVCPPPSLPWSRFHCAQGDIVSL